jgi:hypothetical protein
MKKCCYYIRTKMGFCNRAASVEIAGRDDVAFCDEHLDGIPAEAIILRFRRPGIVTRICHRIVSAIVRIGR